jgi:hypothetical protein
LIILGYMGGFGGTGGGGGNTILNIMIIHYRGLR